MKKLNQSQKLRVNKVITDIIVIDKERIQDDSNLRKDLGFDSLDFIELIMNLEKEFDLLIPDDKIENIKTVDQMYQLIANEL